MIGIISEFVHTEILIKLGLAALLSLIIGVERELKKKPVGLKTSLVIATFSCLLTYISIESAYVAETRDDVNITMDPLRLAAQIVSGIGFLGAGVILRKGNDSITGLTTAAMIWGAGGIGIAVGAGFYVEATICVLIVLVGIELLPPILFKYGPKRLRMKDVYMKVLVSETTEIEKLVSFLTMEEMVIESLRIKDIPLSGQRLKHEVEIRLSALSKHNAFAIYNSVHSLPYIDRVELEILS
ncbi:MgtC/SapB family protein [Paenisporosarcina sp. TG20]|uniref:MgtC/SapB family protein n=1 Tax=Paenisporosarcina sp. TG20 TaxID=1211706 RepID=UPI0003167F14|nr:MgtC/SapB family protein [Paenisporosarcina sp. TG20]